MHVKASWKYFSDSLCDRKKGSAACWQITASWSYVSTALSQKVIQCARCCRARESLNTVVSPQQHRSIHSAASVWLNFSQGVCDTSHLEQWARGTNRKTENLEPEAPPLHFIRSCSSYKMSCHMLPPTAIHIHNTAAIPNMSSVSSFPVCSEQSGGSSESVKLKFPSKGTLSQRSDLGRVMSSQTP